jgi:hypothetical protein
LYGALYGGLSGRLSDSSSPDSRGRLSKFIYKFQDDKPKSIARLFIVKEGAWTPPLNGEISMAKKILTKKFNEQN